MAFNCFNHSKNESHGLWPNRLAYLESTGGLETQTTVEQKAREEAAEHEARQRAVGELATYRDLSVGQKLNDEISKAQLEVLEVGQDVVQAMTDYNHYCQENRLDPNWKLNVTSSVDFAIQIRDKRTLFARHGKTKTEHGEDMEKLWKKIETLLAKKKEKEQAVLKKIEEKSNHDDTAQNYDTLLVATTERIKREILAQPVEEKPYDVARERGAVNQAWQNLTATEKDPGLIEGSRSSVEKAISEYNQIISKVPVDAGLGVALAESKIRILSLLFRKLGFKRTFVTLDPQWTLSQKLQQDADTVTAMKGEIEYRLQQIKSHRDQTHDLREDFAATLEEHLQIILKKLDEYEKHLNARENYEGLVARQVEDMANRQRVMASGLEQRTGYEKEPVYRDIESAFKAVAENPIIGRDPEFKAFWEAPGEGYSAQRQREMRQLFMSIMGEATNEFTDNQEKGFVLGKDFGADWRVNAKQSPYLYNEWLKWRLSDDVLQQINQNQTEVAGLEAQAKALSAPQVKDLYKDDLALIKPDILTVLDKPEPGPGEPAEKNLQYHTERERYIGGIATVGSLLYVYGDLANREEALAESASEPAKSDHRQATENYKLKAKQLVEIYLPIERAKIKLYRLKQKEESVQQEFTRAELGKPKNKQLTLELAMKQFIKAVQIIDQPVTNQGTLQFDLNPKVRQELITLVYREGVAGWRKNGYDDNIADEYYGMLAQLAGSEQFNNKLTGSFTLDDTRKNYLILARQSGLLNLFSHQEDAEVDLAEKAVRTLDMKRLHELQIYPFDDNLDYNQKISQVKTMCTTKGIEYDNIREAAISAGSASDAAAAVLVLDYLNAREKRDLGKHDALKIDEYLKNPISLEAKDYLNALRTKPNLGKGINATMMDASLNYMRSVEVNYNLFDLREDSKMNYLDRMGISIVSSYDAYLKYLETHPDMRLAKWGDYYASSDPTQFGKLTDLLNQILPESKGKFQFMLGFSALKNVRETPLNQGQRTLIGSTYEMIKYELQQREEHAAAQASGDAERVAKLDGMNIGEKIEKYGRGVFDMIAGPGQSITTRAAGLIIMMAAWKAARSAWKGEDGAGKALRMLFLAGAAEIGLKEFTGRGILDRMKILDSAAQAIEGTYEAVLVQQGEKFMNEKEINPEEHAEALYQLDPLPFDEVMEWYKNTDPNGNPNPPTNSNANNLWSKLHINTTKVRANRKGQWTEVDETKYAKNVIKKTVQNFFFYVQAKDGHQDIDGHWGEEVLRERWIRAIQEPGFNESKMQFARYLAAPNVISGFRGNSKSLTWQKVMWSEIDQGEVEATKHQRVPEMVEDWAKEKFDNFQRWTRREIVAWSRDVAWPFFKDLTEEGKEKVVDLLDYMRDAGATKIHEGAEGITLWYKENQYTIRHFGQGHWELIKAGIKTPFEILYAADEMVIPFVDKVIRQTREILRPDQLTSTKEDLQITDILDPTIPEGDLYNPKNNKEFSYFGWYQTSFREAFNKGYDATTDSAGTTTWKRRGEESAFYTSVEQTADPMKEGQDKIGSVGYYITEVSREDIGPVKDTQEAYRLMGIKAGEQAKQRFIKEGVDPGKVDDLMYSIHTISKRSTVETPDKLYVFWRMPLPGSSEYELKTTGRWTDWMNPNIYKDRPPFIKDPTKSLLENLKDAYGMNLEKPREVGTTVAKYAVQWVRIVEAAMKHTGELAIGILTLKGHILKGKFKWLEAILYRDEETLQWLDEVSGSASDASLALSNFYQNRANADIYKAALHEAWAGKSNLNLATDPSGKPRTGWKKVGKCYHDGKTGQTCPRLNTNIYDGT